MCPHIGVHYLVLSRIIYLSVTKVKYFFNFYNNYSKAIHFQSQKGMVIVIFAALLLIYSLNAL